MAIYKAKTTIIFGGRVILEGQTFNYDGEDHGTPDHNIELVEEPIEEEVKTQNTVKTQNK